MDFGQNVKRYRELRGLTQAQLAVALGYKNKASIGKIENGDAEVPVSMALKMAEALGVDVMALMHGEAKANEFVPYLDKAEEWQLKAVRQILNMPEKNSDSSRAVS